MSSGVMCEKDQQQYECNDSHAIYNLHFTNKSERYEALAHSPQFNHSKPTTQKSMANNTLVIVVK